MPACGKDKAQPTDSAEQQDTTKKADGKQATKEDAAEGKAAAAGSDEIVVENVGFKTPESVLYDAVADLYLVSNINGSPTELDNNGFISRVRPDGTVDTLRWIEGGSAEVALSAPKGMALSGETLFVTDVTVVRKFDRKTGAPRGVVAVEGSTFLNDLCTAPDQTVYVSDSGLDKGTDAVHQIGSDGSVRTVIKGADLGGPNGLLATDEGVWVVTFRSGELLLVDASGEKKNAVKPPKGGLDGLVRLGDGSMLMSSWGGGALYRGPAAGPFEAAISNLEAPADLGYDSKRKRVLIPLFKGNAVRIQPLQ
jgi:sugar lactone lactonase YvrE